MIEIAEPPNELPWLPAQIQSKPLRAHIRMQPRPVLLDGGGNASEQAGLIN